MDTRAGTAKTRPQEAEEEQAIEEGTSVRDRLRAWWNGEEIEAAAPTANADPPDRSERAEPPPPPPVRIEADPDVDAETLRTRMAKWPATRIEVNQRLWGEGFVSPGGPEYILTLAKPLALNPTMSIADLGAGLGGPARTISGEFGTWITGMERHKNLASVAAKQSEMAGFAKKAAVSHYDPETLEFNRRYNCFFVKESTAMVAAKNRFFEKIRKSMKEGGQLLFTDFFLKSASENDPAITQWLEHEPEKLHLWTVKQMEHCLKTLNFDTRIFEDTSEEYVDLCLEGWANLVKTLNAKRDRHILSALVDEAELWTHRLVPLTAGKVGMYRIHAVAIS